MKSVLFSLLFPVLLAVPPAPAQATTEIYGIVDAGLRLLDPSPASSNTKLELKAGQRSQSRWGLRGSEDLAGGLATVFALEGGFDLLTGETGQGGRLLGRQAYVGLRGGFGTLAIGRFALPGSGTGNFDLFARIDPFSTGFSNVGIQNTFSIATGTRIDNGVLWQSEKMNGLRLGLIHSFHIDMLKFPLPASTIGMRGLAASYEQGDFYFVVTLDRFDNPNLGQPAQTNLQTGITYDLGRIRLHAAAARESHQFTGSTVGTSNGANAFAVMLGASIRLGNGKLLFSGQIRNGKALGNYEADRRVWSLGYEHSLSRRTMLYYSFAHSCGSKTLATDPAFNYRQAAAGIRHLF